MLPVSRVIGHKEWAPGRKTDPLYDMNWRRSEVAAFTPQGDDMPLTLDDFKLLFYNTPFRDQENLASFLHRLDDTQRVIADHQEGFGRRIEDTETKVSQLVDAASAPAPAAVAVDAAAVANALAANTAFLASLAKAVNDDADKRARDGDPKTGPAS